MNGGINIEKWKDIIGFENEYEVSNTGKVRSKDRIDTNVKGDCIHRKGRIIKALPNSSGYLRVQLTNASGKKRYFVHRLVALHFCDNPNPMENKIVNHIDNNYLNNNSANLEWTTMKGNIQHSIKQGRMRRTQTWIQKLKKSLEWTTKPVRGYDPITGKTIYVFQRITECKELGFQPSCICMCCKGIRKYHHDLCWEYIAKDAEWKAEGNEDDRL